MEGTPDGLALRAYVYGFPLVFNLEQVERYVREGIGKNPAAPWNTFSHARELADPHDTFVTINNDTVYSMAQLDLSVGPVQLEVPDTAGRYYVLQFVDAWTNNFAYIGHRATGTGAGRFLLVPPGWQGEPPADTRALHSPTRVASIVGRWAVADVSDLPTVHALQDATRLVPLDPTATPLGLPVADSSLPAELVFWDRYRTWSREFPPAQRDRALQDSFAALGLTGERLPADPAICEALLTGAATGAAHLEDALRTGGGAEMVNGWMLTYHSFDYNLDYFEVGSLDEPRFKNSDPERRLLQRAAAALGGLWGNQAFEAAYIATYVDDRGEQLTGARRYLLRLAPTPPVKAFWSLTMYDVPDYYLVPNAVERYSIGDRTPGLVYDDDGGLTITIARDEPRDPVGRANWLPSPSGTFRPVLRMYEPDDAVIEKGWVPPAITRAD